MNQFFGSGGVYENDRENDRFYPHEGRASSEWLVDPSAGTPMTRGSSTDSASTTYSSHLVQTPSPEYRASNSLWVFMPAGNHDSLWAPMSDSSHNINFPPTSYDSPPYIHDTSDYANEDNWWEYYDFVADVEAGQLPYWRLRPGFIPTDQYPATRAAENMSAVPPGSPADEGRFICLQEGCTSSFRRKADLQRHYSQIHTSAEQRAKYPCDWKRCQRSKEPFHRRDHQREHYRDYHYEDLTRRGSSNREDEKWWNDRKVHLDWWRCTRCLERVQVEKYGYVCPVCRISCELERQYYRKQ